MLISFRALLATKFLSHTYRKKDRHFPEIVKSWSGHPNTCKSIKNRKTKIRTKPTISSIYKESKNIYFPGCIINFTLQNEFVFVSDIKWTSSMPWESNFHAIPKETSWLYRYKALISSYDENFVNTRRRILPHLPHFENYYFYLLNKFWESL